MKQTVSETETRTHEKTNLPAEPSALSERAREAEGETFERYAIFGSFDLQKTSRLRRGYLTCVFSSGELDLREAEAAGELELDVRVFFSSLEIEVPSDWEVVVEVAPIFGSAEVKGRGERSAQAPILRVRGICLFGSVEVKRKRS